MYLAIATILSIFRMVVIPAQFQDKEFEHSYEELQEIVASAEDYYNREFGHDGQSFSFDLSPIVSLSKPCAHYGDNYSDRKDILLYQAVIEACTTLSEEVDFTLYDNDDDGTVDMVFLLTAGTSEDESSDAKGIWPQYNSLKNNNSSLFLKGRHINNFCSSSENSHFGVFCHELAHYFGLPDFYDTDGEASGGLSTGLMGSSLMDEGCKRDGGNNPPALNAIELELLGFAKIDTLKLGNYTLYPDSDEILKAVGQNKDEYFLLECDREIGLKIYYVDKSLNPSGFSDFAQKELSAAERWELNQINCRPDMKCADLLVPSGNFSSDTNPSFVFRNGNPHSYAITGIKRNAADGSVSFNVVEPLIIKDINVFQDAAIIEWNTDESIEDSAVYELVWDDGSGQQSVRTKEGASSYTIEGLKANTTYKLTLRIILSEESVFSVSRTFTTKSYRQGTVAYIYLNNTQRNTNGSFPTGARIPLRVFNANNPVRTEWFFNNIRIDSGSEPYFTVRNAGTLKAVVHYEDGSTETLIKEIRLQ